MLSSPSFFLRLSTLSCSSTSFYEMVSFMTTFIGSITVLVCLLYTLYARLFVEYPRNPFVTLSIKLPKILPIIENVAFASKYSEVFHLWLLFPPDFIWCLFCSCSEENPIPNVTRSVHCFSPKLLWNVFVEKHYSRHFVVESLELRIPFWCRTHCKMLQILHFQTPSHDHFWFCLWESLFILKPLA